MTDKKLDHPAELAQALAAVVAGHGDSAELTRLAPTDEVMSFVAGTLARSLPIQDWDAIEALLPVCCEMPDESYAVPLSAILDRQSLEISNSLVIEALGRTGSPDAVPALRRAFERTSVPHANWMPDETGLEEAHDLRKRCAEALRAVDPEQKTR